MYDPGAVSDGAVAGSSQATDTATTRKRAFLQDRRMHISGIWIPSA
jgi:hypothetical protein